MRNALKNIAIIGAITLPSGGCAALWVADKTVDAALFATETTVKVGATAAKTTWHAGSAVVGMAAGDDECDADTDASGQTRDCNAAGN